MNAGRAEYVLSIAETMPRARATAVIAGTSCTSIVTEPSASSQISFQSNLTSFSMSAPAIGS